MQDLCDFSRFVPVHWLNFTVGSGICNLFLKYRSYNIYSIQKSIFITLAIKYFKILFKILFKASVL